jgi:hypothetical protein
LLPRGADVARASIPQEEIAALFSYAAQADSAGRVAKYLGQFREEFGIGYATAGFRRSTGQVLAGVGYDDVWSGPTPVDDASKRISSLRGALTAPHLGGAIALTERKVSELQAVLTAKAVGLWAGRKEIGYTTNHGGPIVLNAHSFDAVGLFLTRPLMLPVLGAVRFETHLSKIDNVLNMNGAQNRIEPWFWTARGSFEAGSRLRVGVNRAMMFGGEGNIPVTASRVFNNLIGVYASNDESGFANQVISVDFRYRASHHAAFYVEWGADDAYGGWWHTPAIIGGVEFNTLPRNDVSFGLERTEFKRRWRTNSVWYQNAWFRGSWADDGVVLGHPLGGHGTEWRVFAEGAAPVAWINVELTAYTRSRRSQNLFAPDRQGRSLGGSAHADARINRSTRLFLRADAERASGAADWKMLTGEVGVRLHF